MHRLHIKRRSSGQQAYGKQRDFYVNDRPLQLALREWRQSIARPAALVSLCAAAAILSIVGPYGTETSMHIGPRAAYWILIVFLSYGWGAFCDALFRSWRGTPLPLIWVAMAGLTTGIGVLVIVGVLNLAFLNYVPQGAEISKFILPVMVISMIVTVAINLALRDTASMQEPTPPALLDRLPFDKRAALIALSVEDHYVRVHTLKGEDMILMRLSDAIRETGDVRGAQVHRSHWAAFDQVTAVRRDGDRAILTMTGDIEVPVSRANIGKLKEAGLL